TRPADNVAVNFVVSARVAFKPTYQSASERATAEAYKYSYFFPGWSFLNPSRIALSVTDDIHNRFIGFFTCALSRIQRATNSPSLPAYVAITPSVTSSLFNWVLIMCNWFFFFGITIVFNVDGSIGN